MTRIGRGSIRLLLAPLALGLVACSDAGPSGPGEPLPDGGARISGQLTASPAVAESRSPAGLGLAQGDDFVGADALSGAQIEIRVESGGAVATVETTGSGGFSSDVDAGTYIVSIVVADGPPLEFMLDLLDGQTLFAQGKVDQAPNGDLTLNVQIFRDGNGDGLPDDSFRIFILERVQGDIASGILDIVASQDDVENLVTICHVPPGNPNAAHTLVIGAPALQAHLGHGDFEGECDGDAGVSDGDLDDDGEDDDLGQPLVLVCHIPPGDPDNPVTIEIAEPAVAAHLNHGDTLGPCPGDSGPTDDDEGG